MRKIEMNRKTNETDIKIKLNLDGMRNSNINTGVPFLDHMLTLFSFFGSFDLTIDAKGDLNVDDHHVVEDIGLILGQAFYQALGNKQGITRYASAIIPMDDALSRVVVDCSNRSYLVFHADFKNEKIGSLTTQNIKEFFKSFVNEAKINLHIESFYGENDHHIAESIFKAFGKALKDSTRLSDTLIPSTKGVL